MYKRFDGFTLAEVLITLVIIGVIAAMTIPSLMNKTNEQETVVAVKKAYSVLGQAFQKMVAENGEIYPSTLGSNDTEATKNFASLFVKHLNVQKICGTRVDTSSDNDCFATETYKYFNGSAWDTINGWVDYKVSLSDGMSVMIRVYNSYSSKGNSEALEMWFGNINVDVNGHKGPNTLGKDFFQFYITKYGIFPAGSPDDTNFPFSTCRTNGRGCTAWVVTKGNMDYLQKDVSW